MITDNDAAYEGYLRKMEASDPEQTSGAGRANRDLFSRYASLLKSVHIPDISVADVEYLSTALGDRRLPQGTCPRDHLMSSIDLKLGALDEQLAAPAAVTGGDQAVTRELRRFTILRGRVDRWTPAQCMKVVEALEYLRARDGLPVEVTAATVQAHLKGEPGKVARKARRRGSGTPSAPEPGHTHPATSVPPCGEPMAS